MAVGSRQSAVGPQSVSSQWRGQRRRRRRTTTAELPAHCRTCGSATCAFGVEQLAPQVAEPPAPCRTCGTAASNLPGARRLRHWGGGPQAIRLFPHLQQRGWRWQRRQWQRQQRDSLRCGAAIANRQRLSVSGGDDGSVDRRQHSRGDGDDGNERRRRSCLRTPGLAAPPPANTKSGLSMSTLLPRCSRPFPLLRASQRQRRWWRQRRQQTQRRRRRQPTQRAGRSGVPCVGAWCRKTLSHWRRAPLPSLLSPSPSFTYDNQDDNGGGERQRRRC